jgi:nucleotide-binding universal stress UspA family protein
MTEPIRFETLLVPVDFSPPSRAVFQQALGVISGKTPVVILLHVLDTSLAELAESHGLGSEEEVREKMRERAQAQLKEYAAAAPEGIDVDCVVSEGVPFLEILQKAKDFAVDAIVMAKVGRRGKVENLLFGSTAEKVVRGSESPVLVLLPKER